MSGRLRLVSALWLVLAFSIAQASAGGAAGPSGEAFREGMTKASWASAIKQFFGTAYEAYDTANRYGAGSPTAPISRVWFTGTQGVLSEVYWPTIDNPQTRDSQLLVTDGGSFFFEERRDSRSVAEWLEPGVPAFKIVNVDPAGRFVIEKRVFADPDRDVVIEKYRITRHAPGLRFYVLHNPSVGNTPMGNSARASLGGPIAAGLYAWQGSQAQVLYSSIGFSEASAGFEGASDGWRDLRQDFRMDWHFATATAGNVVLTARLPIPETAGETEFDLALGFGASTEAALSQAQASLAAGTEAALEKYRSQWRAYQASLRDLGAVSSDNGGLFRASVAVIKSMEDKTFAGAYVASPTVPWGEHQQDGNSEPLVSGGRSHLTGGYHLVWPRDLFQMATSFMALGDSRSAVASLDFLRGAQYGPQHGRWEFGFRKRSKDGSFPQNMWVNGEPLWAGLQLDETAMPVVLAYRLWKGGQIRLPEYWDMVRRAGDFIREFGPWTAQERW
jgi:glucoamylase